MEQGIIDKIVSQKAFDEVERLEKAIMGVVKSAEGVKIGGNTAQSSGVSKEYEKMIVQTERLKKVIEEESSATAKSRAEKQYLSDATRTATREQKLQIQINESLAGSYNQMQAQLSKNLITLKALSEAERNNAEIGGKLIAENQRLNASLKAIDSTMGIHTRNVGNYKSGLFGMSQVLRELPNFAIDARIGFMSLSNNLPYLADEFSKVKHTMVETKDALGNIIQKEAGTKAAFKAMLGSIISVNTVMVLLSTALVLYGDKIVDWVGKLFGAKKPMEQFASASHNINQAIIEGGKNALKESSSLEILYKTATNVNKPMKQRVDAVNEMQKLWPSYFGNLSTEKILVGEAGGAYQDLTKEILKLAVAKALSDKYAQNAVQIFTLENQNIENERQIVAKRTDLTKAMATENAYRKKLEDQTADPSMLQSAKLGKLTKATKEARERLDSFTESTDKNNAALARLREENEKITQTIDASALIKSNQKNATDEGTKSYQSQAEALNVLEVRSQAWIELLNDSAKASKTSAQQLGILKTSIENVQYEIDKNSIIEKYNEDIKGAGNNAEQIAQITKNKNTLLENLEIKHTAKLELIRKETNDNIAGVPDPKLSQKALTQHEQAVAKSWEIIQNINKENGEKEKKQLKLDQEAKKKIIQAGLDGLKQLYDSFSQYQQDLIDNEKDSKLKQLEMNTQAELNNENLTAQQKLDINAQYEAEKNRIEKAAFEKEKNLKIANIGIEAALAEVKIFSENAGNTALIIVLSAILAATTAASIAQIKAQKYPAFEKGGTMQYDGMALVGEKRTELGVTPDGKMFLTPDVPTLMHLERGTKIYPDASAITSDMIAGMVMKSNVNLSTKSIEKKLDEVVKAVKGLKSAEQKEDLHKLVTFARQYKS